MSKDEQDNQKPEFQFCPQCGRKGLYHVREHYYRCRYCGTYRILNLKTPDIEPEIDDNNI
jgi:DNA-directed RNA polymerase subunit RPC12/RpoP